MISEKERLEKRLADREKLERQERERHKKNPNERMIGEDSRERIESYPFFCNVCQEDFDSSAIRNIYHLDGKVYAVWRARCPYCDEWCVRYISHRDEDPYYYNSKRVLKERSESEEDLLQPGEYGFNTRYGEPYKKAQKLWDDHRRDIFMAERRKGLSGNSLESKERLRKLNET